VIPEAAKLEGTARSFDPEVRDRLPELIEQIATGVAGAHGAQAELEYIRGYQAVVNDESVAELVRGVVSGDALTDLDPIMGGDDFSAYLAEVPGCYAFIGAGSEESGATYMHHHPRFRIDERALATGVRMHVDVALRALTETAGTSRTPA
jgi:amidohydrolase